MRSLSLNSYRHVVIDAELPHRIVAPDGAQNKQLCEAINEIADELENDKLFARYMGALTEFLTKLESTRKDGVAWFLSNFRNFRNAVRKVLRLFKAGIKNSNGTAWVDAPSGIHSKISDMLVTVNKVGASLTDTVFKGFNPALRKGALGKKSNRDSGRYFRLKSDREEGARCDDPRAWDKWRANLVAMNVDPCFPVMGDIARYAGKRGKQIRTWQLYDIFVSPDEELTYKFATKQGNGSHDENGYLPQGVDDRLKAYISGPRALKSGLSLAEIERIAKDPRRNDELKVPVFTEDGVNPVDEYRQYRVFRKAAERANLFFVDQIFRETGKRRYITFHYLRHEFVHVRMDAIIDLPDAEYRTEKRALIAEMNWGSGESMLKWYSQHHTVKVAGRASREHNDRIDEMLAPRTLTMPEPSPIGHGHEAMTFADGLL